MQKRLFAYEQTIIRFIDINKSILLEEKLHSMRLEWRSFQITDLFWKSHTANRWINFYKV